MPLPVFAAADFLAAFQRLLPTGRVWRRDMAATITRFCAALMPTYVRLAARDNALLVDTFPTTTTETLPEWEASLGLPDPCLGPSPTTAARQAQVVARLTATGGASKTDMIAYAAVLGHPIAITEMAPARFGLTGFGEHLGGLDWGFAWNVVCDAAAVSLLTCELARIKPAQTILLFNFQD